MEAPPPFQQWVDAARPRTQLWRTAVGIALIVVIWAVWSTALLLIAIGGKLIERKQIGALLGDPFADLTFLQMIVLLLVTFATIWGLGMGVWAATKLLHKRGLATVLSYNGSFNLPQFAVGGAIIAAYLALSLGWSVVSGHGPHPSGVDMGAWLIALGPLAVVVLFQSVSEELLFRGYLPQQLAARFRHPLVWGFLPTLVFGVSHAANTPGDVNFMIYYVASATVLGLVMTASVWRTGGLSAAWGMHFVNNIVAMTVAGPNNGAGSTTLLAWAPADLTAGSMVDFLLMGLTLAFVLSPFAPLPKGQPLRRNETRAAP